MTWKPGDDERPWFEPVQLWGGPCDGNPVLWERNVELNWISVIDHTQGPFPVVMAAAYRRPFREGDRAVWVPGVRDMAHVRALRHQLGL